MVMWQRVLVCRQYILLYLGIMGDQVIKSFQTSLLHDSYNIFVFNFFNLIKKNLVAFAAENDI